MSKFNRIHLVVLDSVGIGAAPDANNFVNAGVPDGASDTLGHISKAVGIWCSTDSHRIQYHQVNTIKF